MDSKKLAPGATPQSRPSPQASHESMQTTPPEFPPQSVSQFPSQAPQDVVSTDRITPNYKKRSNLIFIMISALILVATIVIVLILAIQPQSQNNNQNSNSTSNNQNAKIVSIDDVRSYCNRHSFPIIESSSETLLTESLQCQSSNLSTQENDDALVQVFSISYEDGDELLQDKITAKIDSLLGSGGIELENTKDYQKYYAGTSSGMNDVHSYLICNNDNCTLVMSTDDNTARQAVVEIGYPDRSWPSEEDRQAISIVRRDVERKNDMSRVDISLVQYQSNHGFQVDNLPSGPSYWQGTASLECGDNVSCDFIKSYFNAYSSSDINSFIDPDGTPYSMYITENWASAGAITPTFGNDQSYLVTANSGESYTIGGNSPFSQHIIYIIPGGVCSDDSVVLSQKRHFAIMYMLEDETVYCIDDQ